MEPQQARLTLLVFLAFSAAIILNALYFQKDGGFFVRGEEGQSGSLRRGTPVILPGQTGVSGKAGAGAGRDLSTGATLLRAIRRELTSRNYFPGHAHSRLDQRVDAMTIGAIMAFQYDHGLRVSGQVTQALLKSFLFGVARSSSDAEKTPKFAPGTRRLVAEVQGILSAQGDYGGKIDGLFAGQTRAAIKRFESRRGLPVSGRISGLLVQELSRSTGVEFYASQH